MITIKDEKEFQERLTSWHSGHDLTEPEEDCPACNGVLIKPNEKGEKICATCGYIVYED